eukprot:Opistho-2@40593
MAATTKPFDGWSTGEQVTQGLDLSGKIVVVTGANTGIGLEAARVFALRGATVVLGCRNKDRGEEAVRAIKDRHPHATVRFMRLDLASQASVREFAAAFLAAYAGKCHILVCNAAVFVLPNGYEETAEGIETTVGVHVGHFLLSNLLKDALVASAPSRLVIVSSESHAYPVSRLNVPNEPPKVETDADGHVVRVVPAPRSGGLWERFTTTFPLHSANYNHQWAYSQAKLCDVMFAREFSRRFGGRNGRDVLAVSLHPGNMIMTDIARNSLFYRIIFKIATVVTKTIEQGAANTLYCSTHPDIRPGAYYNNCAEKKLTAGAIDEEDAGRLWRWCETVTGIRT